MHTNDYVDYDDETEDPHMQPRHRLDTRRPYARLTRKMAREADRFKQDQADAAGRFAFTYHPARFEEWWLLGALGPLYENKWIGDVLRRVKSGKEACVYQCAAGAAIRPGLAAAKVYRPWSLRNMRNDWTYREGRADLDDEGRVLVDGGMLHAIEKRTEYGRELLHESWIAYEFRTLKALHAAGADVPEPLVMAGNVILMDFIGDAGRSAPTLNEVDLEPGERRPLFERVVHNMDVMLEQERIHGDLSAYNILYWNGRISLIDFPQVVSPGENPNAYRIFQRDVRRVCDYFGRQGLHVDAGRLSQELWESHGYAVVEEAPGEEIQS
jgi:RIO kinase 1